MLLPIYQGGSSWFWSKLDVAGGPRPPPRRRAPDKLSEEQKQARAVPARQAWRRGGEQLPPPVLGGLADTACRSEHGSRLDQNQWPCSASVSNNNIRRHAETRGDGREMLTTSHSRGKTALNHEVDFGAFFLRYRHLGLKNPDPGSGERHFCLKESNRL